ncbi:MAG: hypothetical protein WAZ18_03900 [Alphaproteobacteria bacterium]
MRTRILLTALLCPLMAWAENDGVGPAAVTRPLEGEVALLPLPPETTTLGPAATVSQEQPLSNLPTEAQLEAAARAEAEAKRPPPLKPVNIPQQVHKVGEGHYVFTPQESPLQTNGTLNGRMFHDETETLAPVAEPVATQPEPTFRDDLNTVRDELQNLQTDLETVAARLRGTSPTQVASPTTVAAPTQPSPTTPPQPMVAQPPTKPLNLAYTSDAVEPDSWKPLKAWAAQAANAGPLKLQILSRTVTPPLGTTADELATARWHNVKSRLAKAGVNISRVSFIRLREAGQSLSVKVVK